MSTSIKKLREARYLSLEDVAAKIGVTEIELKRMEHRWDDPSPVVVRDLAVLLDCNVHDLIGRKPDPTKWADWPYAVVEVGEEEYGGVYLEVLGMDVEFAISTKQKDRIARQLEELSNKEAPASDPWISIETLCGRWLHINPRAVRTITLKHDDDTATPFYAHPEVYLAMLDERPDGECGPVLRKAIEEAVEARHDQIEPYEHQSQIKVLFLDGTERIYDLNEPWIVTALLALDAQSFDMSPLSFLLVEHEGPYLSGWINLSQVAMLDIPMERYLRLSAPE